MFSNSSLSQTATTIVFIDSSVSDYQTLQTGVVEGVETVILSPNQDGIEQISQILQQHPHITTIHILSHGAPGCLYLGNSQLNLTNIHNYTQQLQNWQRQNILLYGCNVAAGDAGEEFIHKLHQITTATISASTTKTGNAALGGNWQLEVNIPVTETFHGTSLHLSDIVADTLHSYQGVFAPTLVGEWDFLSYASAVTVVGNYAYAVGDRLDIIDITDRAKPVFKGSYDISYGQGVQVVGNYAYVADSTSGLQIIDISNPTTPTLKGNYYTLSYAEGVQVVGNYAYVADYYSGLQIIDISNPTTPTLKGNYDISGLAAGVQVVGNYAYVTDSDSGLQIIDISNPTTPTLKGNYNTPGRAWRVQVVGNYAYVTYVADDESGLQIIDISNPTTPTLKGNYDTLNYAYGVQVVGNYAYVADYDSGLQIIDISNPTTPTLKGNYDISGYAYGVQVVGNYAYVADSTSGLQIIDISNPTTPTLKGNYDISGYAWGVQVVGNYAYVADFWLGLQIIDISNPTTPTLKGNYYTSGDAIGVQVVGNYAYVADGRSGLQIIDISNPTTPTLKGNYNTSGIAYGVQVVGNYAYVADDESGLQIIDISNPTTPTRKGNYNTSGYARGVQVVGNYAYVADSDSGLQIIDISNPTTPTLKGNYDTSDRAFSVQVVGNYAYVADYESGLQIIDISNPTTPTLKGNYDTSGRASSVQVVGNYAYVADYDKGLQIIDVSEFTNKTPTNLTLSTSTVAENQIIGTVVGNLSSTDPDTGNTFTYSLVTGNGATDNSFFTITNNQLKTNSVFDFETKNSYNIRVKTTDQSGLSFEKQLTIGVSNVNETPTNLTLSNSTIAENQIIGTVVGNLTSTDPDTGNTFTYSLVTGTGATDNSLFTITGNQLKTNTVFDFETKNSYNIRVKTTDQGGLSFEKQLTIGVSNVNETPTNLTLSNSTIAENQIIGTVVGDLTSTDPDTGNTFTYSLVTGTGATDNSLFTITGNQLKTNTVFDFETKNSYNIRVKTTDQSGLSFEKQLTIGVSNVNETPTNLTLSNSTVAENQIIGTVVGDLTSTDPDTGNTFTYSLVTGTGATDNSLFTITGNQLKTNAVFDFETKNSYNIRVKTTDQSGLSFEKQLTIGVSNVNETPTNLTLSNSTVAENQIIGTVVGDLTSTDPDTGNTFTYSLVTGNGATDNSFFTITNNQLKTNAIFEYETKNSYSVRLRTTDQGGLFFEKQLNISVTDLNDNESFTTTAQQDIIDAQGGEDTITSTFANLQQNDTIKGGNGTDTLIISGGTVNDLISIDTSNTTNQLDIPGTTVFGFERFDLTSFTGTISFNGTTGNDWIKAGTGNDDLGGGDGNDTLNGGAGADLLGGSSGNDTYVVDNAGDVIIEFLNQGIDTVESSITWILKNHLENLTLQGITAINGIGNNLNNIITGNTADNVLTGGLGNDTLIGGAGNDSYYVDNTADSITENLNEGTDRVFSSVTYTLTTNLENLTLQGTTAINGTGNNLNNIITGNIADNVLTGGLGNDTLTGNAGSDTLIGGQGNDSLYLGSDNVVDNVNYVLGDGTDTVYQFVRGVSGDKLNFTGIANFDVITSGTSTLVRVGDGIGGNTGFGNGQLLVTLLETSGFTSANANINLFGGNFLFN
jgi:hypothetical protein